MLAIILSGIDGSGKTTHSLELYRLLSKYTRIKCTIIHYEFNKYLKMIFNNLTKIALAKDNYNTLTNNNKQHVNNFKKIMKDLGYFLLWFINDIVFLITILRKKKLYDIIIMDRVYFIDGAGMIALRGIYLYKVYSKLIELLNFIFNIPTIIILLDVPPHITLERRPEHCLFRQRSLRISIIREIIKTYTKKKYMLKVILIRYNKSSKDLVRKIIIKEIKRNIPGKIDVIQLP